MKRFIAMFAACAASSAGAADFGCVVQPAEYLGVDGGGFVLLVAGKHVKICSFLYNAGDATPDICKIWYSHVATARGQDKAIELIFHESQAGGATSCASLTDWALTPPYYIVAGR